MRSRATSPLVVYGRTRRRYFNVGAKTLMRLSGGEDYELAEKFWPEIAGKSEGHDWAPYCYNTNLVI